MTFNLRLSDEDLAALPEHQRFLLEQIEVAHRPPERTSHVFRPEPGLSERGNFDAIEKRTNSYGGMTSDFVHHRKDQ